MRKPSSRLVWLLIAIFASSTAVPTPQSQSQIPIEFSKNDPLSYAVLYARRTNNQFALSEISVRYAELGDFEQALLVNESATDEDWRTGAFGKIALEYWKQNQPEKARALFLRVANMPLPKDYIYIWGDIITEMAKAQMFELALETDQAMADAGGSTAGHALAEVVEEFIQAKAENPTLPDILPRVIAIAKELPELNDKTVALKRVALAYIAQGKYDRATKLVQTFEDEFDRDDGAHELAIEFARNGLYDRALPLANQAGVYFSEIALVGIASEALKRGNKTIALDVVARAVSLLAKGRKDADYEPNGAEATRLSEIAALYLKLGRKSLAVELADLSLAIAGKVGKPGERHPALRSAIDAYCELGLYDKAIETTKAFWDSDQAQLDALAQVGEHAQRSGSYNVDTVANVIQKIQTAKLEVKEPSRVEALVRIARAGAEQGRIAAARQLLSSLEPFAEKMERTEKAAKVLKYFAMALAEVGNIRAALQHIPKIQEPYFITQSLIEIGTLCAKKKYAFDAGDIELLNKIAQANLPPAIQPSKLTNNAGWEIPGLARATALRLPELQRTRDRTIQLYFSYYEPEVETFIDRPFPARGEPRPEQANWTSKGLKVSVIEERTINGRKFCYRLTVYEIFEDKQTRLPRYSHHLETLFYYDEDGDGKFETLEEGLGYFGRGHIPKWVLHVPPV